MTANKFQTLPLKNNYLGIGKEHSDLDRAKIAILSCPYEKTTSYGKGTRNGPKAILGASHYVEFFDEETHKEVCFEQGIASISPISFLKLSPSKSIGIVCNSVEELIKLGKFVVTLGGEHTISIAPIKAYFQTTSNLSILHLDAHSDLRAEYEGNKFSHASFAARVSELTKKITQIGVRAQCKEESQYAKETGIHTYYAYYLRQKGLAAMTCEIIDSLDSNVYITFDLDFLDPSIMPSTGTPEPGGFFWDETVQFLKEVIKARNLVGFDVVELAPRRGFPFPDFLAAKLIYKILNYRF